ncbi:hypothetical protein BH23VER1_BH23VER1_04200 [soil metagenome]
MHAGTSMGDLLKAFPGAQRAIFARYHIGGCRSCGFRPDETLAEVCARNDDLPVDEVIAFLQASHSADESILVSPAELAAMNPQPKLLDTRTREEFEAVHIPGAALMSQDLLQEAFGSWPKDTPIVVYDHTGTRSLDAAAYLIGHGFGETRSLDGGIDAYSREIDRSLPRYRVEYDD